IQLTPVYTGGPVLRAGEVIPLARTAVPVEWDDFRQQLERLAHMLQPTQPGGASPLGEFINTAADNLRGQGVNIRDSIIELAQVFSALGDHSQDIFSTVRNLATLVSALQSSTMLMRELNINLASVTALLANEGNELGQMFVDVDNVAGAVDSFVADNREALGTTSDKLTSISQAVADSIDDVKQTLHVGPTAFQNFVNIYEPAHSSLTGALAINNFSDPITFLCGAIQAASRLRAEQAAKLCVQYLAPIVKNRQYNFPPIGLNPFVNAQARPNEVTYSEDWLRPGHRPSPLSGQQPPAPGSPLPAEMPPTAGDAAVATDPAAGLPGVMGVPDGGS
ncbi:MAG: MCE family protein, partial [Actinomycetota bacterium]|nr:MCE family protein [Actinomycetota bacterium]